MRKHRYSWIAPKVLTEIVSISLQSVSHELFVEGWPEEKNFNCDPHQMVFTQQPPSLQSVTKKGNLSCFPAMELPLPSAYPKQVFFDFQPSFYLPLFFFAPLTPSGRARYLIAVVKVSRVYQTRQVMVSEEKQQSSFSHQKPFGPHKQATFHNSSLVYCLC